MLTRTRSFGFWISCFACLAIAASLRAQEESLEDFKYKEDYDRVQSILKNPDPVKRAERFVTLYGDRADMRGDLRSYVDNVFTKDMEAIFKQGNFTALKSLSERALKTRPRFAEAHFFRGLALKREKKMDEALKEFARAYVLESPIKANAKQQLDLTYRSTGGSLAGQEKIVLDAMKEFNITPPKKRN